jgi:hypothetical protein
MRNASWEVRKYALEKLSDSLDKTLIMKGDKK